MWFWIMLGLVLLALLGSQKTQASRQVAERVVDRWRPLVEQYRAFYPSVPLARALAVIAWESRGDPLAVNPEKDKTAPYDDSVGLFQITDPVVVDFNRATGKRYDFSMLTTPYVNVEIGLWNLARHLRTFGDLDLATRAHNGGAGGVTIPATAEYLRQVKAYDQLITEFLS